MAFVFETPKIKQIGRFNNFASGDGTKRINLSDDMISLKLKKVKRNKILTIYLQFSRQ